MLLLLLCSCTKKTEWVFSQVHSLHQEHCSTRLKAKTSAPFSPIEMEVLQTQDQLQVFLHVPTIRLTTVDRQEKILAVECMSTSSIFTGQGQVREGGQRIVLDAPTAQWLLASLEREETVTILIDNHRAIFQGMGFKISYDRLYHPPPAINPFRLPF